MGGSRESGFFPPIMNLASRHMTVRHIALCKEQRAFCVVCYSFRLNLVELWLLLFLGGKTIFAFVFFFFGCWLHSRSLCRDCPQTTQRSATKSLNDDQDDQDNDRGKHHSIDWLSKCVCVYYIYSTQTQLRVCVYICSSCSSTRHKSQG